MSLLNPAATATNDLPAPVLGLAGPGLAVSIGTAVLTLGISRVGGEAIVADLHAGGYGLFVLIASFLAFALTSLLMATPTPSERSISGIYKFTRNPAYLAFFIPLAALAYFSLATAAACIVIYVTLMNLTVIRKEEQVLQHTYGDDYLQYRKAVPRWFA